MLKNEGCMNKLKLVIAVIFLNICFFSEPIFSKCSSGYEKVIPKSGLSYQGGLILFESVSSFKTSTNSYPRRFSLKSKKHDVLLNVLYSNKSEYLLKPSMKLQVGKEYTLYDGYEKKPFHWVVKK